MRLIGLYGHPSSGKTTIANHLASQHGFAYWHMQYPAYEAVAKLFMMPTEMVVDHHDTPMQAWEEMTPRELTESLCEGFEATFGVSLLVRQAHWVVDGYRKKNTHALVIDGISNWREARWLKRCSGVLWDVRRESTGAWMIGGLGHDADDAIVINNDRPIEETLKTVDSLVLSMLQEAQS